MKKEEKTNGRTEQAARIYGTKGKDLNGLSQKAFSYSPWQTTMAKWREREHILNRFPSSVRDIFTCKPATDASSQPLCQRVQHVARYRRCVCVRRHRTVATCLLASTEDSCPFLFFSFLSFPFFGGSEFKRFKAISLGVNRIHHRSSNADRPAYTFHFVPPSFLCFVPALRNVRILPVQKRVKAAKFCQLQMRWKLLTITITLFPQNNSIFSVSILCALFM